MLSRTRAMCPLVWKSLQAYPPVHQASVLAEVRFSPTLLRSQRRPQRRRRRRCRPQTVSRPPKQIGMRVPRRMIAALLTATALTKNKLRQKSGMATQPLVTELDLHHLLGIAVEAMLSLGKGLLPTALPKPMAVFHSH